MAERIKIKEILKFLVAGTTAVIVDFALYRLLVYVGFFVLLSKAISYVAGATVGFIINKLWTFESKHFSPLEIIHYIALYAISACANALVNKLVLVLSAWTIFAFLCATGTSMIMNFFGQKYFVFVIKEGKE